MRDLTRDINAVVARTLVDSAFLGALAADRDTALKDMGLPRATMLEIERLDCARLEQIAGFICKAQNNDLWRVLPLTLRLLRVGGHELEIFGAYHPNRPARGASFRERAEAFVQFLLAYLAERESDFAGFIDLLRHEWVVAQLANGWYEEPPQPARDYRVETRDSAITGDRPLAWRPRHAGLVLIRGYRQDPLAMRPGASRSDLKPPATSEVFLCYVSDKDADVPLRVFRMDPAVAMIVGSVNGQRTPEDLAALVGGDADVASVLDILDAATDAGLVLPPALARQSASAPVRHQAPEPVLLALTGHAVSRILYTLDRAGVLERLAEPCQVNTISAEVGVDRIWLTQVLEFVAAQRTIVERLDDGRYVLALDSRARAQLSFSLAKFVGAYGPCLDVFGPAAGAVGQAELAEGFALAAEQHRRRPRPSLPALVLREVGATSGLLDLGCGTGELLIELAKSDASFSGIGVDANAAMCAAARTQADRAGVASRVRIYHGDALDVVEHLPRGSTQEIDAAHAGSFFNALFGAGTRDAVRALTRLRQSLGDAILIVNDYYGRLGSSRSSQDTVSWPLLQDIAQVCSGQGVPPPRREDWERIYHRAGCRLILAYEGDLDGYARFIHAVRLGAET